MSDYCLDSNAFIEGKKGPYGFDIAPRFWELIDELTDSGQISCSAQVYDELLEGQDDLEGWARDRRSQGLFVEPDAEVQEAYRDVVAHVVQRYPDNQARRRFLNRADPWVIAHAIAKGCTVVTLEMRDPEISQQVKIPNVCDQLNVSSINTYQMLRELGVSWNT